MFYVMYHKTVDFADYSSGYVHVAQKWMINWKHGGRDGQNFHNWTKFSLFTNKNSCGAFSLLRNLPSNTQSRLQHKGVFLTSSHLKWPVSLRWSPFVICIVFPWPGGWGTYIHYHHQANSDMGGLLSHVYLTTYTVYSFCSVTQLSLSNRKVFFPRLGSMHICIFGISFPVLVSTLTQAGYHTHLTCPNWIRQRIQK